MQSFQDMCVCVCMCTCRYGYGRQRVFLVLFISYVQAFLSLSLSTFPNLNYWRVNVAGVRVKNTLPISKRSPSENHIFHSTRRRAPKTPTDSFSPACSSTCFRSTMLHCICIIKREPTIHVILNTDITAMDGNIRESKVGSLSRLYNMHAHIIFLG